MEQVILEVLLKWANKIKERIESRWDNMSQIPGNANLQIIDRAVIAGAIMVTLSTSDFKAFIAEYGSGHLLDENNPYLEAYKKSPMFNPEREYEGYEFIGRQQGDTVYSPDGTTYQSSGQAHRRVYKRNNASYRTDGASGQYGLHMEHDLNSSGNNPGYKAFEPQHVIETEIKMALDDIIKDVEIAVAKYMSNEIFNVSAKIVL